MASVDGAAADLDPASLAAVTAALQAAVGMNPEHVGDLVQVLSYSQNPAKCGFQDCSNIGGVS
jgi:hypothetical protein